MVYTIRQYNGTNNSHRQYVYEYMGKMTNHMKYVPYISYSYMVS